MAEDVNFQINIAKNLFDGCEVLRIDENKKKMAQEKKYPSDLEISHQNKTIHLQS